MLETSSGATGHGRDDRLSGLRADQEEGRGLSCKRQRGEEMHRDKFMLHKHVLQSHVCTHTQPNQISAFMWNVLG